MMFILDKNGGASSSFILITSTSTKMEVPHAMQFPLLVETYPALRLYDSPLKSQNQLLELLSVL